MNYFKQHYPIIASVLFAVVILVAHLMAVPEYDWRHHTISHLGSQKYEFKIIMQVGFLLFGTLVVLGVLLNKIKLRTIPILLYGLGIALTGVFCAAPFFAPAEYNPTQAILHSIFAQISGVAFSIGILIQMFYTDSKKQKVIYFLFFLLVMGISATFGLLSNYQGLAQRVLYVISLFWFSVYFRS